MRILKNPRLATTIIALMHEIRKLFNRFASFKMHAF